MALLQATGYSSLSRILSLPLKLIKIDKSLVQAPFINRDKKSMILLDNFIKTAFAAGFDIVAEGVETNEMAKHVIALGCTYIQGFYFSKPLSKTDFVDHATTLRRICTIDNSSRSNT